MNSKTRSESQRALNSNLNRAAKIDFIRKNREQITRISKRNRSSSFSKSKKMTPENPTEITHTQPQITNLNQARDRLKLQRISEANSAAISQDFENSGIRMGRLDHRLSYSQPQLEAQNEDVSTGDEINFEPRTFEAKEDSRWDGDHLNIVSEGPIENTILQENYIGDKQINKQSEDEEDMFLKTFGSSQHSKTNGTAKTQTPGIQAVEISYSQKHLTDYHLISPKPILRSVKKEDPMKQTNITHYITESKQSEEKERFYDAVDETPKLMQENSQIKHSKDSRDSSELDMILETHFDMSHANVVENQHSSSDIPHDIVHYSPVYMELELPTQIQASTLEASPAQLEISKKSELVHKSYSKPETFSQVSSKPSEITIPLSLQKSISFDIPEPELKSPHHTPYVHNATPYPPSYSQSHLHDLRSQPVIYYSQQQSLNLDSERKSVNPTSLYNLPETHRLNQQLHITPEFLQNSENLSNTESNASSVMHTPEPAHLQKPPESVKENSDPTFRNINYDKMPMSEQIKRSARRVKITDTGEEIPDVTWTELKLKLSSSHYIDPAYMENIQVSEFKLDNNSHTEQPNVHNIKKLSFSQSPEKELYHTPDKLTISIQTSPVNSNIITPIRRSARLAAKRKNVIDHTEPRAPLNSESKPEISQTLSSEKEAKSPKKSLKRKLNSEDFTDVESPGEISKEYYSMRENSRSSKKMKYR